MLLSMGLQRIGHDQVTEQQQQYLDVIILVQTGDTNIKGNKLLLNKFHKLSKIAGRINDIISKDLSQEPHEPNNFPSISPKLER